VLDSVLGLVGFFILSAIVVGIARFVADAGSGLILSPVMLALRDREEMPGWMTPLMVAWRIVVALFRSQLRGMG